MVWDKTLPPGNTKISGGDNSIRDNNDSVESAIDQEHAFATGDTQTGRHSFDRDTEANRDAPSVAYEDGGIFFADNVRSSNLVLQVRDGGAWENADVDPKVGGVKTLPRLNEQSLFSVSQAATLALITPAAGLLAVDFSLTPGQYTAPLTSATMLSNPINSVANHTQSIQMEVIMNGTGGWAITFGTAYRTPSGTTPAVATGANARTMLFITRMQDGNFLITSAPGLIAII